MAHEPVADDDARTAIDLIAAYDRAIAYAFTNRSDHEGHDRIDTEAVVRRLAPCGCGRLEFDGRDVDRTALTSLALRAGWTTAAAVLLAALDYAHRAWGCTGQANVIREIHGSRPGRREPVELTRLLGRLMRIQAAGTPCNAIEPAFTRAADRAAGHSFG
ncbi:hypothetical protein [Embleya scabrispora]|uniref:hypothetical protein n=1 Tax=Embleya scabrispora TaxID=159449 RepID=UPI00036D2018|nr:hypothetical protein [Embleya scabrispora]MYS85177.1 hypothetical protein [Streptomyces sp. SID5474]